MLLGWQGRPDEVRLEAGADGFQFFLVDEFLGDGRNIEPTFLASSKRHLSLELWFGWRNKIGADGTAVFPNPITGKDFTTPEAFKQFLDRRVKPLFPWFHGYGARNWCVYARIIDAGFTDTAYHQVAEWFGHDSADMTRSVYGPSARAYAKSPAYGRQWLIRAFQNLPSRGRKENQDGHG